MTNAVTDRRQVDAQPVRFDKQALADVSPLHAMGDAEIETIDMDALLPPGEREHHQHAPPPVAELTPEQKRGRLQVVKFKQGLEDFTVSEVGQVHIASVKRGDVVQIKTMAGSIYIRVVDRIRGDTPGVGEVLAECIYDLQDHWGLSHMASLMLPLCAKHHLITNPDGSQRNASRALKMTTQAELPDAVKNLLRENFFDEIHVHATPVPDKLRLIDVGRWCLRMGRKVKGWIDENNRREREKKAQEEARRQQKKQEKLARKQKSS